jgi:hypothetical protein
MTTYTTPTIDDSDNLLRSASGRGNTNITVNGAIDPEGTARTIVDVLNRANARGGSGAGAFVYS